MTLLKTKLVFVTTATGEYCFLAARKCYFHTREAKPGFPYWQQRSQAHKMESHSLQKASDVETPEKRHTSRRSVNSTAVTKPATDSRSRASSQKQCDFSHTVI